MAKLKRKPKVVLKLLVTGGQATPAPPLGPALSQHRVNIGQFISQFNEATRDKMGVPLPILVRVFQNGAFEFEIKNPPASYLVKRAAQVAKGSGEPGREPVGSITRAHLVEIAKEKRSDLSAADLEAAVRVIEGTARSCGIKVVD